MQGRDVVCRAYDLFAQGRLAEAGELFAPDAVWHFPGQNAISGDYRGVQAILDEFLPKFPALSGSTFRSTLVDVAEGEKHTFALQRSQAERDGRAYDYLVCQLFTLEEGLIREVSSYPYDARAQDALWH